MLDQAEFLKPPENNFHTLFGQFIPVLTHFHTEVLNDRIHTSNQNFPCCNLWCSPLTLSYTSICYLKAPQGSWILQKRVPQRALLFLTVNKTRLVNLSLSDTLILVMPSHTHSLTLMSLLHWGPKTGHGTVPVCSSLIPFDILSTRTPEPFFHIAALSNMGKMELSQNHGHVITGFLQFDDQIFFKNE